MSKKKNPYIVKQYNLPCEFLINPNPSIPIGEVSFTGGFPGTEEAIEANRQLLKAAGMVECGKPATYKTNGHYFCADCLEAQDKRIHEGYEEAVARLNAMAVPFEQMEEL
jgi:hypothetical protein